LPQALSTAHLNAKLVAPSPNSTTLQYLSEGKMGALVFPPAADIMWQMTDAAARIFTGMSVAASEKEPSRLWVLTPSTANQLPAQPPYYLYANTPGQYKKLWGVG
jgi:hypothetical protein